MIVKIYDPNFYIEIYQKRFSRTDLFMKKFLKRSFCLLFLMIFTSFLISKDYTDLFEMEEEDIIFKDLEEYLELDNPPTKAVTLSSAEVSFLEILRQGNLRNPLWKKTSKKRGRNPLDMMTYTLRKFDYRGTQFNFFYNSINRMPITLGETFNFDFISEGDFDLVYQQLGEKLEATPTDSDLTAFFMLLKNVWVQERKAGCLMRYSFFKGPFTLKLDLPILLSERNIMATNQDQNEINNLLDKYFLTYGFDKKREFVRILIGVGDTRLKLGMDVINHIDFKTNIGFSGIFPTASGILLNGRYERPKELTLDSDLFSDLLYNIRKSLLEPELGNNGHFGFGPYLESKLDLFRDKIWFWWRLSYEELIPAKESRLIMFKKTIENPNTFIPPRISESEREEKLNQFKLEYVAPELYDVIVRPGGVFTFDLMANFKWWHFLFGLGYNFYLKRREIFKKLRSSEVNMSSLRIDDATVVRALQHKLVGEVNYKLKFRRAKFTLCLGGDTTFSSWHLGKDWTIYSTVGLKF